VETFLWAGSLPGQARVTYCVGTEQLCVQRARVFVVCHWDKGTPSGASYTSGRCLSAAARQWQQWKRWSCPRVKAAACQAYSATCRDSHCVWRRVTSHLHRGRPDSRTFLIVRYRVRSKPQIVTLRASKMHSTLTDLPQCPCKSPYVSQIVCPKFCPFVICSVFTAGFVYFIFVGLNNLL